MEAASRGVHDEASPASAVPLGAERLAQASEVGLVSAQDCVRAAVVSRVRFAAVVVAALTTLPVARAETTAAPAPPVYDLGPGKPLGAGPARENSGIVKSRQWPDLYWMHNDSGDEPRVYPVHRDGSTYPNERYLDEPGVLIGGAINVDWEDVAMTASGQLVVADCGNNGNDRRDLAFYFLAEPAPTAGRTAPLRRVFFRYPEQRQFPAPADNFNYDAEGVFTLGDDVYLCTKHRSDTRTRLYRLTETPGEEVHPLEYLDQFDVRGQVTGADADATGERTVLLTYQTLWLFDVEDRERPLSGPVKWLPYRGAEDVEAVCFADAETLLVAAEAEGRLYEVPVNKFVEFDRGESSDSPTSAASGTR